MKTATFPALRVSPQLRETAGRVLRPDETLSSLMEQSLRSFISHRAAEDEFIARGLRSAEDARRSGVYHSADEVLAEMKKRLAGARSAARKRGSRPAASRRR